MMQKTFLKEVQDQITRWNNGKVFTFVDSTHKVAMDVSAQKRENWFALCFLQKIADNSLVSYRRARQTYGWNCA